MQTSRVTGHAHDQEPPLSQPRPPSWDGGTAALNGWGQGVGDPELRKWDHGSCPNLLTIYKFKDKDHVEFLDSDYRASGPKRGPPSEHGPVHPVDPC